MEVTINLHKLHINQQLIIDNAKRFNVLNLGRRWGKSSLAVHYLIPEMAIEGFPVAYFCPTFNDSREIWREVKNLLYPIIKEKNEQSRQIILQTGGTIDFWSMDNPDSGRGRKYKRVIIDEAEKAPKLKDSWQNTILPTLMDFGGDAWILSTPKFGETYFKKLFATKSDQWASFNMPTYSNPHISYEEIENIKQTMDELSFRCEILAENINLVGQPFAYSFDEAKHVQDCEYNDSEPLTLSIDFNVSPLCAILCHNYDVGTLHIIDEVRLQDGNIFDMCERLKVKYPTARWLVTGDATGQSRSAITKSGVNYYTIIKQELGLIQTQFKQGRSNPSVKNTRVLLNTILEKGTFRISPRCLYTIRDLKFVEADEQGNIEKDRSSETKLADFLDCVRYDLWSFHKDFTRWYSQDED